MENLPPKKWVNITLNNIDLQVPEGELVVESAKRLGVDIPIFCYHPRMTPVGMCRMCLVETGSKQPDGTVRMSPKPQTSCTLGASEGLVIITDSQQIHKDRKGVLEFLLINHPLDCPVCDRGGECPLQNNTLFYGPSTSRYIELKRHLPKAYPLSNKINLDLERCIQCGRCVRFTEEISGDSELAFRFRGASMQPSTYQLTDFESKFSGNTIEICPVGALTSAQYRFRARPWDLETKKAICTLCSNGCNIWFDYRAGKFVRVNGRLNEQVNEEWTCDKGKFGHDFYNSPTRLTHPLIRRGDRFEECSWSEAYQEIYKHFKIGGNQIGGLVRASVSNETLYLFQKVFREIFKSHNIDYRWTNYLPSHPEKEKDIAVQTTISELEHKKFILVVGTSLIDEAPIVYLRIRKAFKRHHAKVISVYYEPNEMDHFSEKSMVIPYGKELEWVQALIASCSSKGLCFSRQEDIDKSNSFLSDPSISILADLCIEYKPTIITTRNLLNSPQGIDALNKLKVLAEACEGEFNCFSLSANGQGAEELGVLPYFLPGREPISNGEIEIGLGTHGIIESILKENLKSLWVLNADPLIDYYDSRKIEEALSKIPFLVYQGISKNETMAYANVVLPMCAPVEQDGSYTNVERRVQWMDAILPPQGNAKPGWLILNEFLLTISNQKTYFGAKEVLTEIKQNVSVFNEIKDGELDKDGCLLLSKIQNILY